MKPSIHDKLEQLSERHSELEQLLSQPEIINDQNQFRTLSQEYAELQDIVTCYRQYMEANTNLGDAQQMIEEASADPELKAMAEEEIKEATALLAQLDEQLQILLLPSDPNDKANVYLEVRAGTGGDEASLFAGDLFRMYCRFSEKQGWQIDIISASEGEHGGYKEVIAKIQGDHVYQQLKFESGAHRVQRVPTTESQGRVHTSACTVAILPEVEAVESVDINTKDLRIDTFRASGAGGQHVNKTDSAIRITHLPSGLVVECQDERSQHKNKARAMSLLQARLLDQAVQAQQKEQAQTRRSLVGSGDRSERIRTYNFPQGRLTDHRINLTLYQLDDIIEGQLSVVINPLLQEYQADLLAQMSE